MRPLVFIRQIAPVAAAGGAIVLATVILLGTAAEPATLEERLMVALRGVSTQRPEHSFLVDGRPVALEARMYGIFGGFAVAIGAAWLTGRSRRAGRPRGPLAVLLAIFSASLVMDGLNALLSSAGALSAYQPRNEVRLATGLLGGIGLAGFIGPVVNFGLWRVRDSLPFYLGWWELGRDVLAAGLLALLVVRGIPSSEVLSLVALVAVVVSFTFVNTYLWVLGGVGQRAVVWRELDWPVVAALALTVLELAGFSLLRDWARGF